MKKHKKNPPSYAIYNFPYFRREQGFSRLFPLKALLAFITCWSGVSYSNFLLKIDKGAAGCALAALLSFSFFYILLTFVKKRYVGAFVLAAGGFGWLIYSDELKKAAEGFWGYILKLSDGPMINTWSGWLRYKLTDPLTLLTVIYILFGLVCAASSVRRFYPEPIFLFITLLSVPAFLSLSASFHISLGIFIAGMLGQWAVNTSAAANMNLTTAGAYSMRVADSLYKKGTSKLPLKRRMSLDLQRYGRHLSDGFIIFVITLTAIGTVASVFPKDGAIRFDKLITGAAEFFQKVEGWGTNLFSSFSSPTFDGFFSADSGSMNISGGLSPDGHHRTGVKVAEIITENTDKIYLRGDVGYEFDGKSWKSIANIDYSSIYSSGYYPVEHVLDNYIPELQYFIAYSFISSDSSDYFYDSPMGFQAVKVNYARNINTVLFPGTPFIYTFRGNNNFTVKGDFVALANRGRINSMETGVLYPADIDYGYLSNVWFDYRMFDRGESFYNECFYGNYDRAPVSYDDYISMVSVYDSFVYDYYTSISPADSKTISDFLDEFFYGRFSSDAIFGMSGPNRIAAAVIIRDYLLSGRYKYSLSADNFSDEYSPVYTFLNKTRAGHCAMYASTMCLAMRYLGVPARYVTGFAVGGDGYVSRSDGEYKYEVTDSDLHAWVEIYVDNLGWIPFDPTPPTFGSPTIAPSRTSGTSPAPVTTPDTTTNISEFTTAPTASEATTAVTTSGSSSDTAASEVTSDPEGSNGDNSHTVKIVLIVLGCALAVFAIVMSTAGALGGLDRKQRRLLKFFRSGAADKAVKTMLDFMLKLLLLRGIHRIKGETPEKFGIRVDNTLGFSEVVSKAIPVFEKSEFDKNPVFTEEERETVYTCITELLDSTLGNMKSVKRLFTRIKLFGQKINLLKRKEQDYDMLRVRKKTDG